jgi:hypothetical protein
MKLFVFCIILLTRAVVARHGQTATRTATRRTATSPDPKGIRNTPFGGQRMLRAIGGMIVATLVALGLSACAYVGPSAEAKHWERYQEYGPKFTDEEKQNMTVDEKLAIYNANVHPSMQLTCEESEVTGSHRVVYRCFTNTEREAQQETARDWMLAARRAGAM